MKVELDEMVLKEAIETYGADAQIMCAQLEMIFGGSSKVVEMERARKMDRLRNRLSERDKNV